VKKDSDICECSSDGPRNVNSPSICPFYRALIRSVICNIQVTDKYNSVLMMCFIRSVFTNMSRPLLLSSSGWYYSEDCRHSGRNMLMKTLCIKYIINIEVYVLFICNGFWIVLFWKANTFSNTMLIWYKPAGFLSSLVMCKHLNIKILNETLIVSELLISLKV
jgi:hypothetical protein